MLEHILHSNRSWRKKSPTLGQNRVRTQDFFSGYVDDEAQHEFSPCLCQALHQFFEGSWNGDLDGHHDPPLHPQRGNQSGSTKPRKFTPNFL